MPEQITHNELLRCFPGASKSTLDRNPHHGEAPSPEPERPVRHEPVGEKAGKDSHPTRYAVRVISFRRRLLDPDNLTIKWHLDSLRYCGLIPDDSAKHIDLSISQEKVATKEEEKTVIEIRRLPRTPEGP